jgi:hypothetical protein
MADEEDAPTASPDRAERREMARGYREQSWDGSTQYVCLRDPCWYGTWSRANTFDEAEMQGHQAQAHAGA